MDMAEKINIDDINFFSVLNTGDEDYTPIYENFILHLEKLNLNKYHKLIKVDGYTSRLGRGDWGKIIFEKTKNVYDSLNKNHIVICSDLDIVFLRNPFDYLFDLIGEDVDVIFARDNSQKAYGCGFFIAKPSEVTLDLFDPKYIPPESMEGKFEAEKNSVHRKIFHEQHYINNRINLIKKKYKNFKIRHLDENLFP